MNTTREYKLEAALISLILSIREHWEGNEQDLDVICDDIVADLELAVPPLDPDRDWAEQVYQATTAR